MSDCNVTIYCMLVCSTVLQLTVKERIAEQGTVSLYFLQSSIQKLQYFLLFYKYHYNLRYLPEDIIQERAVNIRTRATANLSNSYQYFIPMFTRDRCNKGFFIQSCKLWNDLSDDIINLQFDKFKKAVKRR